jgi:hypothetical protein
MEKTNDEPRRVLLRAEETSISSVLYDELSQAEPEAEPTEALALATDTPVPTR